MNRDAPAPPTDDTTARRWLATALVGPNPDLLDAVGRFGAVDVLYRTITEPEPWDPRGALRQRLVTCVPAEVAAQDRADRWPQPFAWVTPGHPAWTPALEQLHHVRRDTLGGAPLGLWWQSTGWPTSRREAMDTSGGGPAPVVAIVGSRAASPYGLEVAHQLARDLAVRGCIIISGAAFGIDAAAHQGALAVRGATVAALAGGVDLPYPRAHTALLERIAANGAVVSELPPGRRAMRPHFLNRNRLIAALADVTVLIEAGSRSGALNTMGWADDLSRPTGAVPGSIFAETAVGPHRMLRRGAALIEDADDVMALMPGQLTLDLTAGAHPPRRSEPPMTDLGRLICDWMPFGAAVSVADLAAGLGSTPAAITTELHTLRTAGLVQGAGDTWLLTGIGGAA